MLSHGVGCQGLRCVIFSSSLQLLECCHCIGVPPGKPNRGETGRGTTGAKLGQEGRTKAGGGGSRKAVDRSGLVLTPSLKNDQSRIRIVWCWVSWETVPEMEVYMHVVSLGVLLGITPTKG